MWRPAGGAEAVEETVSVHLENAAGAEVAPFRRAERLHRSVKLLSSSAPSKQAGGGEENERGGKI